MIRALLWLTVSGIILPRDVAAEQRVTVSLTDNGSALVNPDMGWTLHFYSNRIENYGSKLQPSDTVDDFPGLSVVYLRVPWAFLEPEEGRFNWSLFDTPAQRWIARGKRIAIRVSCSESWMRYATPQWVQDAGARGVDFTFGRGPQENGPLWDPDYLDEVFLEKLDDFLAAMARRYDGNPNVAFIDVGSFGMWGEGHTMGSSRLSEEKTLEVVKHHIDLHRKHFRQTLLCISDDVAGHDRPGEHLPATDYALSQDVSLRDDSILVQPPPRSWYHAQLAQAFWPRLPVILEHEHYGSSKAKQAWGDGRLLLEAVEQYHASYMSIHWWPRELLAENRDVISQINRRLGYRLLPRQISWPAEVRLGDAFTVHSQWSNVGVAPCYPGGFFALTLKDDQGGIVAVHVDESLDMRDLPVGPADDLRQTTLSSEFQLARALTDPRGTFLPATPDGACELFISVGQRDGTPVIALPLPHEDGQRRYRVGSLRILPQ